MGVKCQKPEMVDILKRNLSMSLLVRRKPKKNDALAFRILSLKVYLSTLCVFKTKGCSCICLRRYHLYDFLHEGNISDEFPSRKTRYFQA